MPFVGVSAESAHKSTLTLSQAEQFAQIFNQTQRKWSEKNVIFAYFFQLTVIFVPCDPKVGPMRFLWSGLPSKERNNH